MFTTHRLRRAAAAAAAGFAMTFLVPAHTVRAAEEEREAPVRFGEEDRRGIEAALREKVSALLGEKNPQGASVKRGSYSKDFVRSEDGACLATFHVNIAEEAVMRTERLRLTLERDPAREGAWKIVSETVEDTYDEITRSTLDDVGFFRFETFSFEREGLKVTATDGSFYQVLREGQVEAITLASEDLAYEYEPPELQHRMLHGRLVKDHAAEVVFRPDLLRITCDPETCRPLLEDSFTGIDSVRPSKIDEVLRKRREKLSEAYRKSLEKNAFAGFRPRPEPDNRYWRLELRQERLGNDRRIAVGYDDFEPREVSYSVYGLYKSSPFWRKVYSYHSEETRAAGIAPSVLERRDDQGRRDYDLLGLRGTVEMALEDSETMVADITFRLKAKRPLRRIPFTIARLNPIRGDRRESKSPKMFVNSIQDGRGRELTFIRLGGSSGIIVFPDTVPADGVIELRTRFENRDAIYKLTPSFSYVSRGGWLPFVRFGDMIHDFDLTVKVPDRYKTLGIGKKAFEKVEDGVLTTRWVPDFPIEFPTVIYGDYVETESAVRAEKSDGTPIPVRMHVDKAGMAQWGITPKSMQVFADEAANALNLYRAVFGVDYPYSKLDLVNDPLGGIYGQAPSSIVYLGSASFWSHGTLGTTIGGNITQRMKSLVAHEVGHQWWGSLIANANDRNYWFVESLAEYSSALFDENVYSPEEYMKHVDAWRRSVLDTDLKVSVQDAIEVWGGGFGAYQAAVYSKGPYAFHIMRSTWGDEKFFSFLRMLAQDLKGQEIVTRDIQRVAEKAFGGDMEWFFDQWLRGVGLPSYSFDYTSRQTEDGKYLVEGKVDQRVMLGRDGEPIEGEFFLAVVPITVTGKSGSEYRYPLRVEGPRTRFRFKISEEPVKVTFNKYGEVLAHDVVASN